MNYSKYTSPHPVLTKKERKRKIAEVDHSCSICESYHPRVRKAHGYLIDSFREWPEYNGYYWKDLVQFEARIEQYDQHCKAFDRRMASYRGRDMVSVA